MKLIELVCLVIDLQSTEGDGDQGDGDCVPQAMDNIANAFTQNFTVRNSNKPRNIPANTERPVDFSMLFLTEDMIKAITIETNAYAYDFLQSNNIRQWIAARKYSRYKKWPENGIEPKYVKQT